MLIEGDLKKQGIYMIEIIGTKYIYIGSSTGILGRMEEHICCLKNKKHVNSALQDYYNGGFILRISVIEEVTNRDNLWEKELHHIYKNEDCVINQTNFTNNLKKASYYTSDEINKIADLYNNGMSGSQISLELYGTRNKRASINKLVSGDYYSIFKDLFKHRPYTQKNKKRGEFTCSPKYRHLSYNDKLKAVEQDKKFIIDNIGKISTYDLGKILNLNNRNIASFIKSFKTNNNIKFSSRLSDTIKNNYTLKLGKKVSRYDINGNFVDNEGSINKYKHLGFNNIGIRKSNDTGNHYKNFIFKIQE
jgi:hypothetical protein